MLAYHYGKGGDAERAPRTFLFRAGAEAARAAAPSEALHFFEEASKLYLQLHGDGGDPRKRALLEKNIAQALYYRGRVPRGGRALRPRARAARRPRRRRARWPGGLRFARNLSAVLARLYGPRSGAGPPSRRTRARAIEIMELRYARAEATVTSQPTRHLFDSMDTLRRIVRLDARTIPSAGRNYAGSVGIFSYGGVSFGIGRRFLAQAEPLLEGRPEAPDYLYYRCMRFIHHFLEGDWSEAHEVPEDVLDEHVRAGHLWEAAAYLGLLGEKRIRCGDFAGFQHVLRRNDELADGFGYQDARLGGMGDQVYLLLEQGRFQEAVAAADAYQEESPQALLHVLALGARAEAQVRAGALAEAARTLARGEAVLAAMGLGQAIPYHASFFHTARYLFDVTTLEGASAPRGNLRGSRSRALGAVAKVASRRPQVYRLAGREAWLRGGAAAAARWWARALAEAERLGARPELARTLHEIAIRLPDQQRGPDGRTGGECFAAATVLYRQLHLDGDLARLERREPA